ncbi:TPA: hypothetical protein I7144_20795 [Vibrio vulnificus]|nr:hypothetical protein [Vibrio vulnificus]
MAQIKGRLAALDWGDAVANMSEQEKLERKREKDRRRALRYRERQKAKKSKEEAQGVAKLELSLSAADRDRLDAMRKARAVVGEPYTREEYISELLQQDEEKYKEQIAALGCCGKCKLPLPQGCEGLFDGDSACWRTRQYREIML